MLELVNHESAAELGFEPGGFGGHDVAAVGNVHDLLHADGIEGKGHLHFATVDTGLQLSLIHI